MKRKPIKAHIVDSMDDIVNVQMLSAAEKRTTSVEIYHYHNCYEVVIIRQGNVDGMLGYVLGDLGADSVLMIGRNLPHGILSVSDDFEGILIHIPRGILSWNVDAVPELAKEMKFLEDSQYGYLFQSASLTATVAELALEMKQASGFLRLSCLYRLLHVLSCDGHARKVVANADNALATSAATAQETPVDRTFRFLYQHFQEEITLDEIAKYANLNPTALCRAFKKKSGCTIFQFVNRLKIEKACQLLQGTDLSVAQIAYQVGYNTFSHFNTQFQYVMRMSPGQYRKNMSG
ncbi:MAG: AraC family transcriptional regulator [Bacteroides sp.]|nr:AraC family transcriptional regulator [Bacteroides sp.]